MRIELIARGTNANIGRQRAGSRRGRRPVGRRRQREGHRPAVRAGRCRGPVPGGQQRRPHRRESPRKVRSASRALGGVQPEYRLDHRQRCGGRPHRVASGDRRSGESQRLHPEPQGIGQGPSHHAVPHHARPRAGGAAGQGQDRHDRARHRAGLRRQSSSAGRAHAGHPRSRGLPRAGHDHHAGQGRSDGQGLRPGRQPSGRRVRALHRGGGIASPLCRRHQPAALELAARTTSGCFWKGPRGPCSTWTTAPIPT